MFSPRASRSSTSNKLLDPYVAGEGQAGPFAPLLASVGKGCKTGVMTVATEVQHGRATRLDIHELVRELNGALGPTLVAAATGSKDRKLPIKWAKDDGPRPGADSNAVSA